MPSPGEEPVKILIVDDLPDKLLVYETILRDLGEELVLVNSGEDALKAVLHDEFAVILLDVNMPRIDGFETATLIRKRKKSAHTPIIFVTAFNDERRMQEAYTHGAVDFISTPIVPTILRAKVNVFVDLFRMTQQVKRHAEQEIALAAERTQRAAAEEANRRLEYLVRAGGTITRSLERRVTIDGILNVVVPEQADAAALALCERGSWQVYVARAGLPPPAIEMHEGLEGLPADWQEVIQQVAAASAGDEQWPLMTSTAAEEDDTAATIDPPRLALPLRGSEGIAGVLLAQRGPEAAPFTAPERKVFEFIAARSSAALTKARLYEEIEFANQQKNRFLSMLAHELRNPLAPIQSAVDLMRLKRVQDPDLTAARDIIARQVTHLVRLVGDLLDISRITLGKIRLNVEPIDATQVVPAAVEISQPLIDEGAHELTVLLPDHPIQIAGDRARLTQVLSNLLNNAAKYTPPGGRIAISLAEENGHAIFCVRDSGVGIPAPMLSRVFDLFTQVEHSLDRSQGGLGIGLTLVRELVEMHGGQVQVTSGGAGQGSEFRVRIPRAADASLSRERAAASRPADVAESCR